MDEIKIKIYSLSFIFLLVLAIFALPTIGKIVDKKKINEVGNKPKRPPNPPEIEGPTSVVIRIYYKYSFKLTDPDGDYLRKLEVDWGDGSFYEINCCFLLENGSVVEASKMWRKTGSYQIKARVADVYNEWSEWAYHPVSVPIARLPLFNKFMIK